MENGFESKGHFSKESLQRLVVNEMTQVHKKAIVAEIVWRLETFRSFCLILLCGTESLLQIAVKIGLLSFSLVVLGH